MRKYIRFTLLLLVAVLLLWYFGRNLDWAEVSRSLRHADFVYLGMAVAIICAGYLLRAVRWKVLLEPITPSSLRELFATTTVGFAAIFLIGRAGEIVRPMWLPMRDRRVRPSAAVVTIAVERVFDLASLICFFSFSLMWFTPPAGHEAEYAYIKLVGNVLLGLAVVGIAMLVVYHRYSARVIEWLAKATDRRFMPARLRSILLSLMRQLATSLDILRSGREIVLATFWTIGLWFAIAVPTWLVILAFGLPLTFVDSIFIMGVASLGSLIPTPGGAAGAFHAATAGSLILLNVDRESAAAVSIIMHLVYFAPAIIFGLYYFIHGDISLERFRSLLSSEHAVEEIETDSPDFDQAG
ncbi:MAG: lysylphosphatidylglycerol synthase transmembrane domain-containing protein [Pyrinomonadaceae bacterium]